MFICSLPVIPCDICFASCLLKKDSYTKLVEVSMNGRLFVTSLVSVLFRVSDDRIGATQSVLPVREVVLSSQSVRASRRIQPPLDTNSESKMLYVVNIRCELQIEKRLTGELAAVHEKINK